MPIIVSGSGGDSGGIDPTDLSFSEFFESQSYDSSYDSAFPNAVNGPNGLIQLDSQGSLVITGTSDSSGNGTITLNDQELDSTFQFGVLEGEAVLAPGEFVIVDAVNSTVPFVIAPGASTGALTIAAGGTVSVSGSSLNSLFNGSGGNVAEATSSTYSTADSFVLHGTDGSTSGIAVFQGDGHLAQGPSPVEDGTYTVGLGVTNNGTITTVSGIITTIQEAS